MNAVHVVGAGVDAGHVGVGGSDGGGDKAEGSVVHDSTVNGGCAPGPESAPLLALYDGLQRDAVCAADEWLLECALPAGRGQMTDAPEKMAFPSCYQI